MKNFSEIVNTQSIKEYCVKNGQLVTEGSIEHMPGMKRCHYVPYAHNLAAAILEQYPNTLSTHGTLYDDGRLIFFMEFKSIFVMNAFFMHFWKYEDKNTCCKDIKDGQWHLYFDLGDPGTGFEYGRCGFDLIYNSKTDNLEEIDKAVQEMLEKVQKDREWMMSLWQNHSDEYRKLTIMPS